VSEPTAKTGIPVQTGAGDGQKDGVVDVLARHPAGLTITEMVGMVGESDTQIRRALAQLAAAGAVAARKDPPQGRGRPTMRFRLVPTTDTWARFALTLVEVIARQQIPAEDIAAAARNQAPELMVATAADDAFGVMGQLGFAPRDVTSPTDQKAGRTRLEFVNCPLRDGVLAEGGAALCAAHRGLIEGMCAATGQHLEEFEVMDPIRVGCRAILRAG
jgi:predicted ArsR family transcriptional regulator